MLPAMSALLAAPIVPITPDRDLARNRFGPCAEADQLTAPKPVAVCDVACVWTGAL
jgi:hypothetical protein